MASGLSVVGGLFTIAAAWLLQAALQTPIAVATSGAGPFDEVVNLGLMHQQAMQIHLAIGSAIVAAIFFAAAAIVATLATRE